MSFKINRVYTRSGDTGETGLVGGSRVAKDSLRVSAYGEIDELNSYLGLTKEKLTEQTAELGEVLEFLQQELFDLGSELATPPAAEYPQMIRVTPLQIERLEKLCDHYADGLPELESFILPGGSELAALFHICRTVCRRAERTIVSLAGTEKVAEELIKYVNRLSDLFFILSRFALKVEGKETSLWQKGGKPLPRILHTLKSDV